MRVVLIKPCIMHVVIGRERANETNAQLVRLIDSMRPSAGAVRGALSLLEKLAAREIATAAISLPRVCGGVASRTEVVDTQNDRENFTALQLHSHNWRAENLVGRPSVDYGLRVGRVFLFAWCVHRAPAHGTPPPARQSNDGTAMTAAHSGAKRQISGHTSITEPISVRSE